jgi:peptidoglycan/xylan/chitin deacetylase (PgdA/CDA1 family)
VAPLMKKEQILEMAASGLVEFGGHSMTHAKLTELAPPEMERQVQGCKASLEGLLGKPVLSFAYPYGFLNEAAKNAVARAGYLFGLAVEWGPNHFNGDLMEIRRVCLSPDAGKFEFFWKTSFLYPAFRRWQKRLKAAMKKPPR